MKIFVAVWAFVGLLLTGAVATAQPAKPTIVLVHGAFADSSSWYGVITIRRHRHPCSALISLATRSFKARARICGKDRITVKGDADTVRAFLAR